MIKKKLKTSHENLMKMNVVFILLIISNIALFIGLFNYYSEVGITVISFETFQNIAAIVATVTILGFISSKCPK